MKKIKIRERGWAGHHICSDSCLFRRNTLITCGKTKVVVSTVGNYIFRGEIDTVGHDRYFETMAFKAKKGVYNDINVFKPVYAKVKSTISIAEREEKKEYIDNVADEMHDNYVKEIVKMIKKGKI